MANIRNGFGPAGGTPLARIEADVRKGANEARRFSSTPGAGIMDTPKLQAMLSGQRAALMRADYVLPGGPVPLASAQAFVGPTAAPVAGSFEASDQTRMNTRIPIIREYFVASTGRRGNGRTGGDTFESSEFDLPSQYGLSIIKRPRGKAGSALKVGSMPRNPLQPSPFSMTSVGAQQQLMTETPLLAYSPEAWNAYIAMELLALLKTDPARYQKLTPSEIWYGVPDLPWTGWSWDGVMSIETMNGRSSKETNDYLPNPRLGRASYAGGGAASKFGTVVTQGETDIIDYTNGRGLQEGATLHFVLSRMPLSNERGLSQTYVTSSKSTPLVLGAQGTSHTVTSPTVAELNAIFAPTQACDNVVAPFRPCQLAAVMDASGAGFVNHELKVHEDEWGVTHYDAMSFNIGRVMFAPFVYQFKPPVMERNSPFFRPVANGWETMVNSRYTILVNPSKDGLFAMF